MQEELMKQVLFLATIVAPIVTGLVEIVKRTVVLKNNYIPVVALVCGVLVGFLMQPLFPDVDLYLRLWAGGIAGMTSVGLYETTTTRTGLSK